MAGLDRLTGRYTDLVSEYLAQAPALNVTVAQHLQAAGSADIRGRGGSLYGYFNHAGLQGIYWLGGSIIPVWPHPHGNELVAGWLSTQLRYPCSILGHAPAVLDIYRSMTWGLPRGVRPKQPVLAATGTPHVTGDARLRIAQPADEDIVFGASVSMFREEVGFSPIENGSHAYRLRVRELIKQGRTFIISSRHTPDGGPLRQWPSLDYDEQVIFKADLGVVSAQAAQIQGVWVHPAWRGQGLASAAMAQLVGEFTPRIAPLTCLYVNDYNLSARRAYAKAGFEPVGEYATVMY